MRPESRGHAFDDLDAVVDAVQDRRVHRIDGRSQDATPVFGQAFGELDQWCDLAFQGQFESGFPSTSTFPD